MWSPAQPCPLAMGVPKRKAPDGPDGAAAPAGAAKRARTEELTGVRFKTQLKDPQTAGPGECGRAAAGEHVRAGVSALWDRSSSPRRSPSFLQLRSSPRARASSPDLQTRN